MSRGPPPPSFTTQRSPWLTIGERGGWGREREGVREREREGGEREGSRRETRNGRGRKEKKKEEREGYRVTTDIL